MSLCSLTLRSMSKTHTHTHTHSYLLTCVESFASKVTWACKNSLSLLFLYLCSDFYLCYSKFYIGYSDKSKTFFMHEKLTLSYWTCLYNDSEFLFSSICVTKATVVSCPCAIILNRIRERNCEINVQIIWKFKDEEIKLRKIHNAFLYKKENLEEWHVAEQGNISLWSDLSDIRVIRHTAMPKGSIYVDRNYRM
jgi:hypothetical protein